MNQKEINTLEDESEIQNLQTKKMPPATIYIQKLPQCKIYENHYAP